MSCHANLPAWRVAARNACFADVKSKRRTDIDLRRFQDALEKIAEALDTTYEALLTDLAGSPEDTVRVQEPASVAGESGPMNLFLPVPKKFKQRFATLESDGAARLCIADKLGAAPKEGMTLKLAGSVIDRMPDTTTQVKGRASRTHKASQPPARPAHVFRISDSTKGFLLQACSHEIMSLWIKALEKAGAVVRDSQEGFE